MQNVDTVEIEKFSQLAANWWDLEGEFKPLHQINPLRTEFVADMANGLFDKNVIDVGCGGGILAEALAQQGAKVTGIDMAEASLEVAKLHGLESGISIDYQCTTAEQMAELHSEAFDVVTCMEMLEHVPDPESVVRACASMVKPGGIAVFSTLNRNLKSYLMAILAAERLLKLVPQGTHDHSKFIKPSELLSWIDSTQLTPKKMTGLHMNPLLGSFYLSDANVDVNYLLCCYKPL